MRFAHLADSHLGYRQYGLIERENDFYDVFNNTIDKIIDSDVDFVIHSGDLFENPRPYPRALLEFQKGFLRLKDENIPVYAIAGNHDTVLRKESVPPQIIYRELGLNLLSRNNPMVFKNGVLICGIQYMPKTQKRALLSYYNAFSKKANEALKSILVSHQGIDKYLPFGESYELEIADIPQNFDYYAMGHIHNYINERFGKGRLVYPGSMEIWRADEYENYLKNGKGFCVVDFSEEIPEVERVTVDLPRSFLREYIDYNEIREKLRFIKSEIAGYDKKPILDLVIGNANFSTSEAYELITEYLSDDALLIRPSYQQKDEIVVDKIKAGSINPRAMLRETLDKKYNNEKISDLSIDLLDNLSKNKMEEANLISDHFYNENYCSSSNDLEKTLDESNKNLDNYDDNIKESDTLSDYKDHNTVEKYEEPDLDYDNLESEEMESSKESLDKYFFGK